MVWCEPGKGLIVMQRRDVSRNAVLIWQGCMELLKRAGVQLSGKRAVVVGRSNIVGTPAAMLLQGADATVTVVGFLASFASSSSLLLCLLRANGCLCAHAAN